MASNKRERELPSDNNEHDSKKKAKLTRVQLNPADCDLDFDVLSNGLRGQALCEEGFAYCWSGARANVGIRGGKYVFGCKIVAAQPVQMEDTPADQQHVCRIGISRGDDSAGNLGETAHSFGYGGTGKFSNAGKFVNYGETFGVGDTIVCTVNLESKPLASMGFHKNGKWLGVAKEFNAGPCGLGIVDSATKERNWVSGIFPHVLLKNVVVEMMFSVEDGLVLEGGHKAWDCALQEGNAVMGPVFGNTKDCEILMMVGLPASGKTTWAEKWVKEHPEKRYLLLGTNLALDQMKVHGLLRKQNYGERFDRLMNRATGIFNTLLARAAKTPRNFIIDQTNVYKGARKRKLRPFFQYRKIAVVVFPRPDAVKLRSEKRFKEMGKEVPAEAVNEMLANYVLPTSKDMLGSDEFFDQVWFPELNREDSQRYLEEMKHTLKTTSSSPYPSKSPAQSFASPLVQKASFGEQLNFRSPSIQSASEHPIPQQVNNPAYSGVGLQGQTQYVSGQYQSSPGAEFSGNYGVLDRSRRFDLESRSPVPGSSMDFYQNYGGVNSYGRPHSESRSSLQPYQSQGEVDPYYSRPNFERSSIYGSNFSSPTTPISYNNAGDRRSDLIVPQPAFSPHSETLTNYGLPRTPFPHSNSGYSQPALHVPGQPAYNPHGSYSTSQGPPYGTPPTHAYRNVPPFGRQQSEGFFSHPGQRYY